MFSGVNRNGRFVNVSRYHRRDHPPSIQAISALRDTGFKRRAFDLGSGPGCDSMRRCTPNAHHDRSHPVCPGPASRVNFRVQTAQSCSAKAIFAPAADRGVVRGGTWPPRRLKFQLTASTRFLRWTNVGPKSTNPTIVGRVSSDFSGMSAVSQHRPFFSGLAETSPQDLRQEFGQGPAAESAPGWTRPIGGGRTRQKPRGCPSK